MTCDPIDSEHWRLSFEEHEAVIVISILAQLGQHYNEDLADMPPALRAYWEGTPARGKASDNEEVQESQRLLSEARAELRSDRLALVEKWIQEFEMAEQRDPWIVDLDTGERDEFVAMINDRRLMLAFEMNITEKDMERPFSKIADAERRRTVQEIVGLEQLISLIIGPQIYLP